MIGVHWDRLRYCSTLGVPTTPPPCLAFPFSLLLSFSSLRWLHTHHIRWEDKEDDAVLFLSCLLFFSSSWISLLGFSAFRLRFFFGLLFLLLPCNYPQRRKERSREEKRVQKSLLCVHKAGYLVMCHDFKEQRGIIYSLRAKVSICFLIVFRIP